MHQEKNDIPIPHPVYRSGEHAALERIGLHMEGAVLQQDFPLHRHEYTEAFFILGGSAIHVVDQSSVPLERGDVFVVKGDTLHGFQNVQQLSIINLMYTPGLFTQSLTELQTLPGFAEFFLLEPELRQRGTYAAALRLGEEAIAHVETLSRLIIRQEQKADPGFDGVLRMSVAALMSFLAAEYHAATPTGHVIPVLVRALDLMQTHLQEAISLQEIARYACVSPRHLQRLFQTYLRTHPMAYLRQLRLEQARALLKQTDLSILEIANRCGFSDPAYFARCFRAAFGVSPSASR